MKASPTEQDGLLRLQDIDLALDQQDFRRTNLPQHAQLVELATRIDAAERDSVQWATRAGDLTRQVRRVEGDVEQVRARVQRDRALLDSGSITSGKQLTDLEREVGSLNRRISDLEDDQLAVMEELEDAIGQSDAAAAELEALRTEEAAVTASRDQAIDEIAGQMAAVQADQAATRSEIPEQLLALYSKLRAQLGGVGAARLRHGRCEGCHLQLPPTEYASLRAAPADEVARCEECRRILVRQEG